MGKYTWLIVLGIIAWQVIAGAVQQASKKQKQERMADAVRQRARQAQAQPQAGQGGSPAGSSASSAGGDLASRRKAQLDELRRRRAARTGSVDVRTSPSSRVAPTRAPQAVAPPTLSRDRAIENVEVGYEGLRASEAAERERREDIRKRARQVEGAQARRADAELRSKTAKASESARRPRPVERPAEAVPTRRPEPTEDADAYSLVRAQGSHDRLRRLLRHRSTMRDLIVLREIIDQPIAMRTNGELD